MYSSFHKSIIRAYDIRGIVSDTLHVKDAYLLGRKFANDIFEKFKNLRIVVGYDGRLSSPILEKELILGLKDGGAEVIRIGLCPSPMLYFASKTLDSDGAIMITGSHNPAQYNGFKILSRENSYYGEEIQNLAKKNITNKSNRLGKILEFQLKEAYLKRITEDLQNIKKDIKVVWDPGNGSSAEVLKSLINIIPGEHIILNGKVDGTFPSHHPDPTVEKNLIILKKTVRSVKADVGIAFDGDGDRIGVIDEEANFISGDQLLLIFSEELLKYYPGAKIISDVKASNIVFKQIKKLGGNPIIWKTGHSLIKTKMKETGALLAGEMSGHVFFADRYLGFDDAIYASLRLLEIISRKKPLKQYLTAFSEVISTPEIKIECEDALKFRVMDKCKQIVKKRFKNYSLIDGIRVQNSEGWWLLRASNTQPALIIRCEASSKMYLESLIDEVENLLSSAGFKRKLKT